MKEPGEMYMFMVTESMDLLGISREMSKKRAERRVNAQ